MSIDAYPSELREFIQGRIQAGDFTSPDDFAIAAADLYRRLNERYDDLRSKVAEGLAGLDAGGGIEISTDEQRDSLASKIKREGRTRLDESQSSL